MAGFMRKDEASLRGLHDLCEWLKANGCRMGMCVEIGSFMGESALVFARYFDVVVCVDPFEFTGPGFEPKMMQRFRDFGVTRDVVRQTFLENTSVAPNIALVEKHDHLVELVCDVVYIDSDHSYEACRRTIERWRGLARWVCGHDYVSPGLAELVDKFGPSQRFIDTSWVLTPADSERDRLPPA